MMKKTMQNTRAGRIGNTLRRNWMLGGSLAAAALAAAQPAHAQTVTVQGDGVNGAATYDSSLATYSPGAFGTGADYFTIAANEVIVDWTPDGIIAATGEVDFVSTGNSLTFDSSLTDSYTVLNRVITSDPSDAIRIDGAIDAFFQGETTAGNIWFYSPGGIVIGSTGRLNVGNLVLTSDAIDTTGGLYGPGGEIRFAGTAASGPVIIESGAQLNAFNFGAANSYLALVAPRVEQHGLVTVDGSAAYVAAEAAELTFSFGLFDIAVQTGTDDAQGIVHDGTTTGAPGTTSFDPRTQYFVAVPKNQAMSMVIDGSIGYAPATVATERDGRVILSAGYDVLGDEVDFDSGRDGASIAFDSINSTTALTARATDAITMTDTISANSIGGNADLFAKNRISMNFANTQGGLNVDGDLLIESNSGTSGGDVDITATGSSGVFVTGDIDILANDMGEQFADAASPSGFVPGSMGDDSTGGNVTLSFDNGAILSGASLLVFTGSLAGEGELSSGTSTAGSIDVVFDNGSQAIIQGAATFNASALAALGGSQSTPILPQTGSSSFGGDIAITLDNGSSWTVSQLQLGSGGGSTNGLDGLAQVASSGDVTFLVGNGANLTLNLFQSILGSSATSDGNIAIGDAGQGAFAFTVDGGTVNVTGDFDVVGSTAGEELDPGSMTFSAMGGAVVAIGGQLRMLSFVQQAATNNISSDLLLDIADASVTVGDLYMRTQGQASVFGGGSATGGSVTVQTTDASSVLEVGSYMRLYSLGIGSFLAPDSGSSTGGDVSLLAQAGSITVNGGNATDASIQLVSAGIAGSRADETGQGATAQGGTALFQIDGASVTTSSVLVQAIGSPYLLDDNGTGLEPTSIAPLQLGEGVSTTGGTASLVVNGGSLENISASPLDDITIDANGYGGTGGESLITGSDGGTGQGGTATFTQTGGSVSASQMTVSASGIGGAGADANVEGSSFAGNGGDGIGGNALVELSGGTLSMGGDIDIYADGNIDSFFYLATAPAQGGTAFTQAPGDGGDGYGGTARFIQSGGDLLVAPQASMRVTASAFGSGGSGGIFESFDTLLKDGTGGDGFGGTASLDYSGGTSEIAGLYLDASGQGGFGAREGTSTGGGFQYIGGDGGDGFGGTATATFSADFDFTTKGSLSFGPDVSVYAGGYGATGEDGEGGDGGDGGNGVGGSASLVVDGAAVVIDGPQISADAFGGYGGWTFTTGASAGDGGSGTAGTARYASLNGGDLQIVSSFNYLSSSGSGGEGGYSSDGTSGNGGDGVGGTLIFDALGGAISATGFTFMQADGFSGQGGFGVPAGLDGIATGGTIELNATVVGANSGSLTFASLEAQALGGVFDGEGATPTSGGSITLNDATDGAVTFDALYLDSGASPGVTGGSITVNSSDGPIVVTGPANFYAAGDLTFNFGGDGGLTSGTSFIQSTGNVAFLCVAPACTGGFVADGQLDLTADGGLTIDGVSVGSNNVANVLVQGGDLVIDGTGLLFGSPLDVNVSGGLSGTGGLQSTGDLGLATGGDIDIGSLVTTGQLVQSGNSGLPVNTTYIAPGSFSVGVFRAGVDTSIQASAISLDDVDLGGSSLTLNSPGAAVVGTAAGVLDLGVSAASFAFTDITATGLVDVFVTGDITGGTIAANNISLSAFGDLTADSLTSDTSIFISANALLGISSLSAVQDIFAYVTEGLSLDTVSAGGTVGLASYNGALVVGDLTAGGPLFLDGLSIDVTSSGSLSVGSAYAYDGDIVLTATGPLVVDYASASGDVTLTSTGSSMTVTDIYAGNILPSEGGQGGFAEPVVVPGAGNIVINAATDASLLGVVSAIELASVDAGGTVTVEGDVSGRMIYISASDLVLGALAQIGNIEVTEDVTLVATGNAAIGSGVASAFTLDPTEILQIGSNGDFSLFAGGTLAIGDLFVVAGDGPMGADGTLTLAGAGGVTVSGSLMLESASAATLLVDGGAGDLYIDSGTGSISVLDAEIQAGSLFLYGNRVIAGSDQTLTDIATASFADLTDLLSVPDFGDGRSLITGGSLFVSANEFYVVNTGADTSFDARRGILANSMSIGNFAGTPPKIVINGVVGGQFGLDTAFLIGLPQAAQPLSSVNGCTIGIGGQCGTTINIELVKKVIEEQPPHSILDGEPRSSIETRVISIENVEPEGFQPLIDEPVTGTGNDDLWGDGLLDGKPCPIDARNAEGECERAD